MKNDLDKFKKQNKKVEYNPTTSVRITQDQKDFLDSNDLSLSLIVRDCLNELIKQASKKKGA